MADEAPKEELPQFPVTDDVYGILAVVQENIQSRMIPNQKISILAVVTQFEPGKGALAQRFMPHVVANEIEVAAIALSFNAQADELREQVRSGRVLIPQKKDMS